MSTREIAGKTVEFDEEGFMVNPDDWTKDIAIELAKEIGIDDLTEGHWKVIDFSRADFAEKGEAPTLRRISKEGGVPTKDLYKMMVRSYHNIVMRVLWREKLWIPIRGLKQGKWRVIRGLLANKRALSQAHLHVQSHADESASQKSANRQGEGVSDIVPTYTANEHVT